MSEDGVRRNSEQTVGGGIRSVVGKFSGDGVDEACATGERGWERETKGPQEAARGTTEEENGRARASRGVSASVGVCAGVKEYELVNLLKK